VSEQIALTFGDAVPAFPTKDEGQEAALASHAAMLWKGDFKAVVEKMPEGRRFTSEDVLAIVGLPTGRVEANANNAVGAMMTGLAKRGLIRKTTTRVPSRRASSHGAELIVWERWDATFQCVFCEQEKDSEERHGGRDTDPGYWCDDCATRGF
jgi:hypothetical protein